MRAFQPGRLVARKAALQHTQSGAPQRLQEQPRVLLRPAAPGKQGTGQQRMPHHRFGAWLSRAQNATDPTSGSVHSGCNARPYSQRGSCTQVRLQARASHTPHSSARPPDLPGPSPGLRRAHRALVLRQ